MTTDPGIQGVVGNIPSVTSAPFFTLVPYNSIPFADGDPTIAVVNAAYDDYNNGLQAAVALSIITPEEAGRRTISFAAGANAVVVTAEDITQDVDISAAFSLPPGSVVLPNIRQTTAADLLTLASCWCIRDSSRSR